MLLAIWRNEPAALLKDAASGVASDQAVIDQGDSRAISEQSHPLGVHGGREGSIGKIWDKDADKSLASSAVRKGRMGLLLLRKLGDADRGEQEKKTG